MYRSHPQTGESRTGIISRLESQQGTAATHSLKSQEQGLSVGLKHSKAHHHSHAGEPRAEIVSRLETQQGTAATHSLKSQRQEFLAGLKHS